MLLSQYHKRQKQKKLLLILTLLNCENERNPRRKPLNRAREIFTVRKNQGAFHNLVGEMRLSDPEKYINYFRMTPDQFDSLLKVVGPSLQKDDRFRMDVLSPAERLCLTLRYLATGDAMVSMSYQYRIGKSTVTYIIRETCKTIWVCLKELVLKKPSCQMWLELAEDFEKKWNFPHCIGALDGKHVMVQAPAHSGSSYYKYKGYHSIVLMAVCDAKYCFTLIDVGAHGRQSDGGIFRASAMGKSFYQGLMNLPEPCSIYPGGPKLPYVMVADGAFQLTDFLMRPFPGRNLQQDSAIYNYRLSRARRMIENAFGILAAKWRIYRKAIIANIDTAENMVLATVCLHNFLKKSEKNAPNSQKTYCTSSFVDREDENGLLVEGDWRKHCSPLTSVSNVGSNSSSQNAANVRKEFKDYFLTQGAVPWQWNRNAL